MSIVVSQQTVIMTADPENPGTLIKLTTLEGVTLNIDSAGLVAATTTVLLIDGVDYLPYGCSVEIKRRGSTATIVTSLLVTPK